MLVTINLPSQGDNGVLHCLNVSPQVEGDVLCDQDRPKSEEV